MNSNVEKLSSSSHAVYSLKYHLVLVTKYRRKCLSREIMEELESCIGACSTAWNVSVLAFNGEVDHVHILLALKPQIAPSVFVNNLKSVTSRRIRKLFRGELKRYYGPKNCLWSDSYCLITVGGAPIEVLRKYIENQNRPT